MFRSYTLKLAGLFDDGELISVSTFIFGAPHTMIISSTTSPRNICLCYAPHSIQYVAQSVPSEAASCAANKSKLAFGSSAPPHLFDNRELILSEQFYTSTLQSTCALRIAVELHVISHTACRNAAQPVLQHL